MSTQDKTLPPLPDLPTGAIMNGRTHIDRLESTGLECEAGTLSNCADWHELKRCFEFLAEWVDIAAQAPQPSPLVAVGEDGEGQENHCPECGAEPGQMCSDEEGMEHGRKVHAVRQAQQTQGVPAGWNFNVSHSDGRAWLNITTPAGTQASLSCAHKTGNGDETVAAQVLAYLRDDLLAAAPQAEPRLDDFDQPIVYDTDEIDLIAHELTGDEGEDDGVTVLNGLVKYLGIVHPGKTMTQVLIETEDARAAVKESLTPQQAQQAQGVLAPDLIAAAQAVVRAALDAVEVHPCDVGDDSVRAKFLIGPMAALHSALAAAPQAERVRVQNSER